MNKKLWSIKGHREKYSDEEVIKMIKDKKLNGDDLIKNRYLLKYVKISDSIYEFYLKG